LSPGGAHRGTANATTYGSPGTYSPARRYRIQLDKITDRPARRRSQASALTSGTTQMSSGAPESARELR